MWRELDADEKPEIEQIIKEYNEYLKRNGWRVFHGIMTFFFIVQIINIWIFIDRSNPLLAYFKILFPFIMFMLSIINIIVQKNPAILRYIFIVWTIIFGVALTQENLIYQNYQMYEFWPVFYLSSFLIGIVHCLEAKRIIFAYWFVIIYNSAVIHLKYGQRNFQFYSLMVLSFLFYPILLITLSQIVRMLLHLLYNNKQLLETIKHILEVFPEGIIIQTPTAEAGEDNIKFSNKEAKATLLRKSEPLNIQGEEDNTQVFKILPTYKNKVGSFSKKDSFLELEKTCAEEQTHSLIQLLEIQKEK